MPVAPEIFEQLFAALGFKVHARAFSVHNATVYCLAASAPPAELASTDETLAHVERQWRALQVKLLQHYEGAPAIQSAQDRAQLMSAAFGVTRIASWFNRTK